jgi:hypothetical protein
VANRDTLSMQVTVEGMKPTLQALGKLGKDANTEMRAESLAISRMLVGAVKSAGLSEGGQAALLAGTAKAKYDRVPAFSVGGKSPLGRHGTPARDLLIGSEFGHGGQGGRGKGSKDYAPHGFRPRQSPEGIWIYPTVRRMERDTADRWVAAANRVIAKFGEGT